MEKLLYNWNIDIILLLYSLFFISLHLDFVLLIILSCGCCFILCTWRFMSGGVVTDLIWWMVIGRLVWSKMGQKWGPKSRKNGPRVWAFCKIEFPGIQKPVQILAQKSPFFKKCGNRGVGVIWLVVGWVLVVCDFVGGVWLLSFFCWLVRVLWWGCLRIYVFAWLYSWYK